MGHTSRDNLIQVADEVHQPSGALVDYARLRVHADLVFVQLPHLDGLAVAVGE